MSNFIDVYQFGAVGDGLTDDTRAIQNAIDYAIYYPGAPKTLYIPTGTYRVTDTLQIGYGQDFVTFELIGLPAAPNINPSQLSGIISDFTDRPCVNIQGGRNIRLSGLTLIGVNRTYLRENYEKFPDRTDISTWFGPKLDPSNNSRHAPYAGLVIDGYAGPRPHTHSYPDVSFPTHLDLNGQYNKHFTSNVLISDCRVEGFCVGIAIQPGQVPDASSGDFVTCRDCSISYNIVGIADGHADARCNNIYNSRMHFNYTAIDTLNYGSANGTFISHVSGSSFDNNVNLININIGGSSTQGGYSIKFDACYAESIYRIGNILKTGRQVSGISFDSCKFFFSVKNKEFSPANIVEGGDANVSFRNCILLGAYGFYNFAANVEMDCVAFGKWQADGFRLSTKGGRIALSYTGGVWAHEARRMRITPYQFFDFDGMSLVDSSARAIDSEGFPINSGTGADLEHNSGVPIPWWVNFLACGRSKFPVSTLPPVVFLREGIELQDVTRSGATYTFSLRLDPIEPGKHNNPDAAYLIGVGDIVQDDATKLLFYVQEVGLADASPAIAAEIKVRQLNRVRVNKNGSTWEADDRLIPDFRKFCVFVARRFYPSSHRLAIEATAGTNTLKLLQSAAQPVAKFNLAVQKGDFILSASGLNGTIDYVLTAGSVADIDAANATISLTTNAQRNFCGDACLFVKRT